MSKEEKLLDVKRAFIIAKALNYQYVHIREDLSPELKKAANEAKAKNAHFIKLIEESFKKRNVSKEFLEAEDELSFQLLETIEKLKHEIKDVNQQNLYPS
jgi:uncharacterized protein YdcH (DUF465 family)